VSLKRMTLGYNLTNQMLSEEKVNNTDIYNAAFMELLQLESDSVLKDLVYQGVSLWDSVGHMELIARLESDFKVMIDMDDVIDFGSYEKGKLILLKYQVKID
jgi:acyl carrier protein